MIEKLIIIATAILAALTAFVSIGTAEAEHEGQHQSGAQYIDVAELPDFDCCG